MLRLELIQVKLAEVQANHFDLASLKPISAQLVHPGIRSHSDKGVRAYALVCLAEIFRICVPNPPLSVADQAFTLDAMANVLHLLSLATVSAYHDLAVDLLHSLCTVKSVALVAEIINADNQSELSRTPGSTAPPFGTDILTKYFKIAFDILKSPATSDKIKDDAKQIIIILVDESPEIPKQAAEILVSQFLDPVRKHHREVYQFTKLLCRDRYVELQRCMAQYFFSILDCSEFDKEGEEFHIKEKDLTELRTAHRLVAELFDAKPELVFHVLPMILHQLAATAIPAIRSLATLTMSRMLANSKRSNNLLLINKYEESWTCWIQRSQDRSAAVRMSWLEGAIVVLIRLSSSGHIRQVCSAWAERLEDVDDKVRTHACHQISEAINVKADVNQSALSLTTIMMHFDDNLLQKLANRLKDKKGRVRDAAFDAMGKIYGLGLSDVVNGDQAVNEKLGWIPSSFFKVMYVSDQSIDATMETYLLRDIFPASLDPSSLVDRLEVVFANMDSPAKKAFEAYFQRKRVFQMFMTKVLEICSMSSTSQADRVKSVHALVDKMASLFPDAGKAVDDILRFTKLNNSDIYRLFSECMNSTSQRDTIRKAEVWCHS